VAGSFEEDCRQVVLRLRGALTEALASLQLDPARPQEMARSLGLHRNLSWKVSKIVAGSEPFGMVAHVPGRGGMQIIVRALGRGGVAEEHLERIRTAMDAFERLVTVHAGDRSTLELVAGSLASGAPQRETMLQARRLAFRGNSAIWGVQARVNLAIHILAPAAADPRRVDLVQVNGLIDFRGLRPDVVWPLFRRAAWSEGRPAHAIDGEPLVPSRSASGVPLLDAFCSSDLPQLEVVRGAHETTYWLPAREVGRTGELSCIYGSVVRSIGSQYAVGDDRRCDLETNLVTPVELLHTDLLVHESMAWAQSPRADVYSLLERQASMDGNGRTRLRLPTDADLVELGLGLGTMATPHVPRYRELLAQAFAGVGWDPSAFRGFRHVLPYPPVPARAALSMDLLPEEPA
jgi:hypothetical protein